ncbi:MAG: DUF2510 domain-containing protein [Acidimicrobiia bacterium]|nr:DUF2510 domain-containing protein [Acidimicrobiia bacterium]
MTGDIPAGWYGDPMGRYEHRYWDGSTWTENVASGGQQAVDPIASVPLASDSGASAVVAETPATAAATAQPTAAVSAPAANVPSAAATVPLKLCPHCQAQSATAAAVCPNCGKNYVKKKKWPWVLGAIFLLMVIGFVGCVAVVGTVASKAVDALNAEQARHAITPGQFAAVQLGTSRSGVVRELGKSPQNAQDFLHRGFLNGQPVNSSCIYYNKAGGSFGDIYQFCFQNDALESKNAY